MLWLKGRVVLPVWTTAAVAAPALCGWAPWEPVWMPCSFSLFLPKYTDIGYRLCLLWQRPGGRSTIQFAPLVPSSSFPQQPQYTAEGSTALPGSYGWAKMSYDIPCFI